MSYMKEYAQRTTELDDFINERSDLWNDLAYVETTMLSNETISDWLQNELLTIKEMHDRTPKYDVQTLNAVLQSAEFHKVDTPELRKLLKELGLV